MSEVTSEEESVEEESQCGKPCNPDSACEECDGYWARMVQQGYWDRARHRWTDKGWSEIVK